MTKTNVNKNTKLMFLLKIYSKIIIYLFFYLKVGISVYLDVFGQIRIFSILWYIPKLFNVESVILWSGLLHNKPPTSGTASQNPPSPSQRLLPSARLPKLLFYPPQHRADALRLFRTLMKMKVSLIELSS